MSEVPHGLLTHLTQRSTFLHFSVSTNKIERREELIDMKILFDDFTTYVESMSDEEIKESIQNATKNTSDCMEEE